MNIRHLRVFNEVCKHMNMTRASETLHISQPAISKTISELEDWYGIRLFERWNRTIFLTPSGNMLYEYSLYIIDMVNKMEQEIKTKISEDLIRVGASITAGTSILSDIVSGFRAQNPSIRIEAVIDNTKRIESMLMNSELDIALLEGTVSNPNITSEVFGSSEIVLVVSPQHPLYHALNVIASDLEGMDFIVREHGSGTRAKFESEMEKLNIRWNAAWVCHNTQAIKNAANKGLGIGVLSKLSVRRRLAEDRFRALTVFSPPIRQHFQVAYHNNKFQTKNLTAFKLYIIDNFNQMEKEGHYR